MRRSTVSGEDPQHLLQPPYRPREPLKHHHHGRAQLLPWNKLAVSTQGLHSDKLESLEVRAEIVGYVMDLARLRRNRPGDDVVSMIATAHVGGRPLSLKEVALNCYSLILGGDESSRISAVYTVKALAEHPRPWHALRCGAASLDTAVEEVLRWATSATHSPVPPSAILRSAGNTSQRAT